MLPPRTQGYSSLLVQRRVTRRKDTPHGANPPPHPRFRAPALIYEASCLEDQARTSCPRPLRGACPEPCGARARHTGTQNPEPYTPSEITHLKFNSAYFVDSLRSSAFICGSLSFLTFLSLKNNQIVAVDQLRFVHIAEDRLDPVA